MEVIRINSRWKNSRGYEVTIKKIFLKSNKPMVVCHWHEGSDSDPEATLWENDKGGDIYKTMSLDEFEKNHIRMR